MGGSELIDALDFKNSQQYYCLVIDIHFYIYLRMFCHLFAFQHDIYDQNQPSRKCDYPLRPFHWMTSQKTPHAVKRTPFCSGSFATGPRFIERV